MYNLHFCEAEVGCLGFARFGEAHVPLDESLARVVVDLSGRPWCEFHADLPPIILGDGFQVEMVREFRP